PLEIFPPQRVEFDPNRETPLKLRNQIRRSRDVKRPGGYEEHVIRLHRAILGDHRRALDDGQNVPLHAFARDVGAGPSLGTGDLVDLIEEYDPGLLRPADGFADYLVLVDQALGLFMNERLARLRDGQFPPAPAAG